MSHLTTTAPSYVAAWQALDDDTRQALHNAVSAALTDSDDGEVASLASLHAATYLPARPEHLADLPYAADLIRKAGRAAVRSARRRVAVLTTDTTDAPTDLESADSLADTLADLSPADLADLAAAAEVTLSAMPMGRLNVGHHGPADTMARYSLADLMAARREALAACDPALADRITSWITADTAGKRGKRVKITETDAAALTSRYLTERACASLADPDPIGEPHPRHGRLSAGAYQSTTEHPAACAMVTVRYTDGREGTARALTEAEAAAMGMGPEVLPSSLPGNGNDDTARGVERNEDGTVPSRAVAPSPRRKRADNGPTITGSPSRLGMTR